MQVSGDSGAQVTIRMTPVATTLEPVVVRPEQITYPGRLAGYCKRLERKSAGDFITREQIDRENPSSMGQLLRHAAGIQAYRGGAWHDGHSDAGPNVLAARGLMALQCPAGESVAWIALFPSSIQGIELYLGSTTAPIGYISDGDRSSCRNHSDLVSGSRHQSPCTAPRQARRISNRWPPATKRSSQLIRSTVRPSPDPRYPLDAKFPASLSHPIRAASYWLNSWSTRWAESRRVL